MVAWLLQCVAADAEQARRGRLLAGLLLILGTLDLFASIGGVVLGGVQSINQYTVASLSAILVLYLINRRGGVVFTLLALLGVIMVTLPLSASDTRTGIGATMMLPVTLVIAVALGGILLSARWVLLLTLLVTGEMGLMANVTSPTLIAYRLTNPSDTFSAMILALVVVWSVGGLVVFYTRQMRQTLLRLEQRNAELATQNARERALIAQMQATAAQVSQSAAAITVVETEQSHAAAEQATFISQTTSTVEELSQAAGQIADAAGRVAHAAEQARLSASRGQEAVHNSITGMGRIKSRINEIVARNQALAEQSRRSSTILASLNQLSNQMHLLALNATIESAAAGSQGQRFAVVAAEVQRVAQDSARATRQVQEIVVQNQAAIEAAAAATEEGLREGQAGLQLTIESGEAHNAIIAEVEHTAQLVHEITVATQQQRNASGQVVGAMREMVGLTRQVAARSQETLAAVTQLNEVAQALSNTVDVLVPVFPVPGVPTPPDQLLPAPRPLPAGQPQY
jgi:methyl-accepting chemotaxis protein